MKKYTIITGAGDGLGVGIGDGGNVGTGLGAGDGIGDGARDGANVGSGVVSALMRKFSYHIKLSPEAPRTSFIKILLYFCV